MWSNLLFIIIVSIYTLSLNCRKVYHSLKVYIVKSLSPFGCYSMESLKDFGKSFQ